MGERSRGPNPWTGLNNRGFREGGYNDAAAFQATLDGLRAVFDGSGYELVHLRYWAVAGQPEAARVRLDLQSEGSEPERYYVNVPHAGAQPWGEEVYRSLRSWCELFVENIVPTTLVPTTLVPTTLVPTTLYPTTPGPTTL